MFSKAPIEIKFKTFDPYVLANLPPVPGFRKRPDWFNNTAPFSVIGSISDNFEPIKAPTIRRCPALNDYFISGVTIPNWSDIEFYVDGPKKMMEWRYANNYPDMEMIQSHSPLQFPELSDKYAHAKIMSPWIAECNSDVSWLLTKPSYMSEFDDQDVVFCDGITQFKNNFVTHVNLFFPLKDNTYTVKFSAGNPIQKYIPLTERAINISTEYCTREYYNYASMNGRRVAYSLGKFYNILKKKFNKEK
jgi:predicted small secreted protein